MVGWSRSLDALPSAFLTVTMRLCACISIEPHVAIYLAYISFDLLLLYRQGYTISSSLSCGGKIPIDFEGQKRLGQHPLPLKTSAPSCQLRHITPPHNYHRKHTRLGEVDTAFTASLPRVFSSVALKLHIYSMYCSYVFPFHVQCGLLCPLYAYI